MNCEAFSQIIHELADYKPMQATLRDAAMSHVALCADCAAKLADGVAVSRSLILAASVESESAPSQVKENLLAAFNELHRTQAATSPKFDQPVVSILDLIMGRRLRWLTAAAITLAAAVLIAVTLPIWKDGSQQVDSAPQYNVKAGVVEPPVFASDGNQLAPPEPDPGRDVSVRNTTATPRFTKQRRFEGPAQQSVESVAHSSGEYLALTYLASTTAFDSGTIVRVELSRSALASLGLPITFVGSGASVKADVVIGDDGVAQAIRLVQ